MVWITDNIVSLADNIATAAATDPVSAVLAVLGSLLLLVVPGAFGALTLGAVLDAVTPESATQSQRPARER